MIDHDDYSGRDPVRPTISRPPFEALHILSAPWLRTVNDGKLSHVGVFSNKQLLQFKASGWEHNSCIYFSEESMVPISIIDGTAWSSKEHSEGRVLIESLANNSRESNPDAVHNPSDPVPIMIEPIDDRWWLRWKSGPKTLYDIIHLFEHGDELMHWLPAKTWNVVKDRNYYYLCKYYVVIYLQKLDLSSTFVADHLRNVDVLNNLKVPRRSKIIQLAKDKNFINSLK